MIMMPGFFFSSRRRHTSSLCDWSSDVCSSDLSGATEPEYNAWQVVTQLADSLSCAPVDSKDTATKCAATNAVATTRFRFRSRIAGTPASPATGSPVYRIYTASTTGDYTIPAVIYLIDRRP